MQLFLSSEVTNLITSTEALRPEAEEQCLKVALQLNWGLKLKLLIIDVLRSISKFACGVLCCACVHECVCAAGVYLYLCCAITTVSGFRNRPACKSLNK